MLIPEPGTGTLPPLVAAKVYRTAGCWIWDGRLGPLGYGKADTFGGGKRKTWIAHRLVYHCLVGPIPDGMTLDHAVCDFPTCVNPLHMEVVTLGENSRRRNRPDPAMCGKRLHPWVPGNIRWLRAGWGVCRPCERIAVRAWKAQKLTPADSSET